MIRSWKASKSETRGFEENKLVKIKRGERGELEDPPRSSRRVVTWIDRDISMGMCHFAWDKISD